MDNFCSNDEISVVTTFLNGLCSSDKGQLQTQYIVILYKGYKINLKK